MFPQAARPDFSASSRGEFLALSGRAAGLVPTLPHCGALGKRRNHGEGTEPLTGARLLGKPASAMTMSPRLAARQDWPRVSPATRV